MKKIKVLIVDDSAFMRKALTRIIQRDESFVVVATARDGLEALEMIQQHRPHVITLDVEMPRMDGLATLTEIRQRGILTPVIVVSSVTKFGSDIAIRCLEAGALEIVCKPESYVSMNIHEISSDLIWKLKAVTQIRPKGTTVASTPTKLRDKLKQIGKVKKHKPKTHVKSSLLGQRVVTIGSSTGGPVALQKILSKLPADFPAAIVVVQHMPPGNFIYSLADRLNTYTPLEVKVAKEGDYVKNGLALMAPIGNHVVFQQSDGTYMIHLTPYPADMLHCPSVDVLFESAGKVIGSQNVSCVLTGMGADGAKGIEHVQQNKGYIIAEAEETCVVFGMPRCAMETGYVNEITPLFKIPHVLMNLI